MALEKVTNEQGRLMAKMKTDINGLKTDISGLKGSILDIKELLQEFKKGDKMSDRGESSVNGEERREDQSRHRIKLDMEEEGELKPWTRRVELARVEKFFEVQSVSS